MLKLGIIGMSDGNGHPYSWSAIINGDYDEKIMADCGFPVIPAYLAANRDTLGIDGVKVTHIWTQDRRLSEHCAAASKIDNVLDEISEMVGRVDAVLLARDDPENHVEMSKLFIDANIPIFIDKPLAFCKEDLEYFCGQYSKGKFIMSSSALRYSAGVQSQREYLASVGKVKLVVAVGAKDLRKYAIHYLEGMLAFLGDPAVQSVTHMGESGKDVIFIEMEKGILATVHVFVGITEGEFNIYGDKAALCVKHGGSYVSFKAQLIEAIRSFNEGKPRLDFVKTCNVIRTLIAAKESYEQGGKTIMLK